MTTEKHRIYEREKSSVLSGQLTKNPWHNWGPYLSERQWGTVREDYSEDGDAWNYTTHNTAVSRAYRWGEEGIAGISDNKQNLCFAMAFWNGKDPFLKERLFGLNNHEGNHGEDVKEYYYYLDSTPTHSYMKMLYKYPQNLFPYKDLINENSNRTRDEAEFELIDTGIFDNDEYFDIFIEYAKESYNDILIKITVFNRADKDAELYIIPQLWFRNTWNWGYDDYEPSIQEIEHGKLKITHKNLDKMFLYFEDFSETLFCDNESNKEKLYNISNQNGYFKDGINEYIVSNNKSSVNPEKTGTKAGISYYQNIKAKESYEINLRLSNQELTKPFNNFNKIFSTRLKEADEFYNDMQKDLESEEEKDIQRQAFAGMLWNKQFYYIDIPQWLNGDANQPPPPESRKEGRNWEWKHLNNFEIISMPDKWEYPWYASWDLAFHCIPLSMIDPDFAKEQLILLTREWYMNPNGQLPAYEWNFSGVNPPVHAWASWRVYKIDKKINGKGDTEFLERIFQKLIFNFGWWVNRKDHEGHNIFQGGFLGLDNIGIFDRSEELPDGGFIEQSDGTSWMAMFSLNMMRISLELAKERKFYQDIATKFFEHFLYIAESMTNMDNDKMSLWDHEDEFFYDILRLPNQDKFPLKIRSIVGLIPLFAVEILDDELIKYASEFHQRMEWFLNYRPDLANLVSRWDIPGHGSRRLLSLLRGHRMKCLLRRMLDQTEFLSEHGIRGLSKEYEKNPYQIKINDDDFTVKYQPAEADTNLYGGNSNWRGPVWFPINYLIIESLEKFHYYYDDDFLIEYPTGSGNKLTIKQIAEELIDRLKNIFLRDKNGRRAVFGDNEKFQTDPHFKDYILFYEYYHGESGKGLGASHQTGWTGLIAKLLQPKK